VAPKPMKMYDPLSATSGLCSNQRAEVAPHWQKYEIREGKFEREPRSKSEATNEECGVMLSSKTLSHPLFKSLKNLETSEFVRPEKRNNIEACNSNNESSDNSSVHDAETFTKLWIYRRQLAKMGTDRCSRDVAISQKCMSERLRSVEHKKATQYAKTRKFHQHEKINPNLIFLKRNTHNPCYISDTVGQIMSFLSLVEVLKAKRVSRVWKIEADITLKKRTNENMAINPPFTAAVGSMLLNQLHILLPRLLCLTISINHYGHLKGLVLSYICECKNLVFLRVENLEWHDLIIATKVILSLQVPRKGGPGHPILAKLLDLELPDSKLPIPTSTQCIRPLSSLAPNLCSLTVKSAQDPIIFSLRLFFPSVRKLFLLDTLWTTRRFAQIVSSSPQLMKFLIQGRKVRMLAMVTDSGTKHVKSSVISKSFPVVSRMHMPGSVPVITSDERLFALVSNHKDSLYVEPLGRIIQYETGRDLTKANISMFAGFCALIGVLIIMPPMDDQ